MKTACEHNREILRQVQPGLCYDGGDYGTWKPKARETLRTLLGMDKFVQVEPLVEIEYEVKIEGATEIRFTFQSEEGYRVPCHLLLPDGVEHPPVIITLQGHSPGMHISLGRVKNEKEQQSINSGDRDFCVRAVKEGFAAIAMEQRNFGECGKYDGTGPRCFQSSMVALMAGRTTIGERVWDVMRLIDVLETEFADRVDLRAICCMGNSGGGTTTAYAAALEDRIALAMPSCAMCTYKDSIGAMHHCSCNYVPHIAEYFDMDDLLSMAYPKYYIQVNGLEDDIFPIEGAKEVFRKGSSVYGQNGRSERCVHVIGNGGHRFYADDAWPVVHRLLKR